MRPFTHISHVQVQHSPLPSEHPPQPRIRGQPQQLRCGRPAAAVVAHSNLPRPNHLHGGTHNWVSGNEEISKSLSRTMREKNSELRQAGRPAAGVLGHGSLPALS